MQRYRSRMTEARRAIRSEELLFERERQGVRTLIIVSCLFVLIMVATVWIVATKSGTYRLCTAVVRKPTFEVQSPLLRRFRLLCPQQRTKMGKPLEVCL